LFLYLEHVLLEKKKGKGSLVGFSSEKKGDQKGRAVPSLLSRRRRGEREKSVASTPPSYTAQGKRDEAQLVSVTQRSGEGKKRRKKKLLKQRSLQFVLSGGKKGRC